MHAVQYGALVAVGAAFVASMIWLFRQGFITAVRAEIQPIHDRIDEHMDNEEDALREQAEALAKLAEATSRLSQTNDLEHSFIKQRLDRLEHGTG